MTKFYRLLCIAVFSSSILGVGSANAATYLYTGTVGSCGSVCGLLDAVAAGSVIEGYIEVNVAPGGFAVADDIVGYEFIISNPLIDPPAVPDPENLNPAYVADYNSAVISALFLTDAAGEIFGDTLFLQLQGGPLNGAGLVFDFEFGVGADVSGLGITWTGDVQLQSPVPLPAAAWLFGSALIGLVGLAKRKKV